MDVAWHNNLYRAYNLPPSVAEKEVSTLNSPLKNEVIRTLLFAAKTGYNTIQCLRTIQERLRRTKPFRGLYRDQESKLGIRGHGRGETKLVHVVAD